MFPGVPGSLKAVEVRHAVWHSGCLVPGACYSGTWSTPVASGQEVRCCLSSFRATEANKGIVHVNAGSEYVRLWLSYRVRAICKGLSSYRLQSTLRVVQRKASAAPTFRATLDCYLNRQACQSIPSVTQSSISLPGTYETRGLEPNATPLKLPRFRQT